MGQDRFRGSVEVLDNSANGLSTKQPDKESWTHRISIMCSCLASTYMGLLALGGCAGTRKIASAKNGGVDNNTNVTVINDEPVVEPADEGDGVEFEEVVAPVESAQEEEAKAEEEARKQLEQEQTERVEKAKKYGTKIGRLQKAYDEANKRFNRDQTDANNTDITEAENKLIFMIRGSDLWLADQPEEERSDLKKAMEEAKR